MLRKINGKLWGEHFDSLGAFYNYVATSEGCTDSARLSYDSHVRTFETGGDRSFHGAGPEEVKARRWNWQEGTKELATLPEMNVPTKGSKRIKKWSEDDGDDMSMERYLDDRPCFSRRVKAEGDKRKGFVRVVVNVCESGYTRAKDMLWKAYAAARMIDELESQRVRCEVTLAIKTEGTDRQKYDREMLLTVTLKRHQEPLNLGLLTAAFTPWFFRAWGFRWLIKSSSKPAGGLGHPRSIGNDFTEPHTIVIDTGEALSKTDAEAKIHEQSLEALLA